LDVDSNLLYSAPAEAKHAARAAHAGLQSWPHRAPHEARKPRFQIRNALGHAELAAAGALVDRMYATRGYSSNASQAKMCEHKRTLLAREGDAAVGTLTVGSDSEHGLSVDELFADQVDKLRASGFGVCEFTKLAVDRRARSPYLLPALFHVAHVYAHRVKQLDRLLIEVNPRHVRYYEAMLGFKVIGPERLNRRVNAPAVLLSLDLHHAREQIDLYGGRPELSTTVRSAYPHFFPIHREDIIATRLARKHFDVAGVYEPELGTVAAEASAAVH
jgi:hypothetical protein